MKKAIAIIITMLFTICLISQNSEKRTKKHSDFKLNHKHFNDLFKSSNEVKQQLDSIFYSYYDENLDEWIVDEKEYFTYNFIDNTATYIDHYLWEDEWYISSKAITTYNDDGYITEYIDYYYDNDSDIWETEEMEEHTYNENNLLIQLIELEWTGGVWENNKKETYEYDTEGNRILKKRDKWNSEDEQWEDNYKTEYIYDNDNNLIESIQSVYEEEFSEWYYNEKREYTYNDDGTITRTSSYYNYNSEVWNISHKGDYWFDENGNPIDEIYSDWNSSTSGWEPGGKYSYSYDLMYNLNNLVLPPIDYLYPDFRIEIINQPLDFMYYEYNDAEEWIEDWKGVYYFSEQDVETGIYEPWQNNFSVYPNPTLNKLSIQGNLQAHVFELYNTYGERVIHMKINNNKEIDVSLYPNGIYIYKFYENSKIVKSGKIILL